jgi:nucleotide-binding universal stress UspA family protein
MFSRILVPVDFSGKNKPALAAAQTLATQNNASITILHVIEKIALLPQAETKSFYTRLKKNAAEKMQKMVKSFDNPKGVNSIVVIGKRMEEIMRYSLDNKIDLIVLGSHKIDMNQREQGWGTLSYRIAILSQCPVLLVK